MGLNLLVTRYGHLIRRWKRASQHGEVIPEAERSDRARRLHTRDGCHFIEELPVEGRDQRSRSFDVSTRQPLHIGCAFSHREIEVYNIGGIESRVDLLHTKHAVDHQAGSHQEHHGQSDLRDRQDVARAAAGDTRGCRAPAFPQSEVQIGPSSLERGRRTHHDGRRERHRHRKQEHADVDINSIGIWKISGEPAKEPNTRERQGNAERPAGQAKQSALHQQLPHQAAAARTERCPHRKFGSAGFGARLQEIRGVGAGDQQNADHGPQKRVEITANRR